MIKYDIVIPSWNQAEYVVNCMRSINAHSKDFRVIFVDNGSDKENMDKIFPELEKLKNYVYIPNDENLGFVKATNQGIEESLEKSDSEYIILMNNDTEAVEGWLEKLEKPFKENAQIGASGSLTTAEGSWQGKWIPALNSPDWITLPKTSMLAFFCTMFKKEVFKTIGMLDTNFQEGLGDDDDYCFRVQKYYDLALVQNLRIPHHHRTTFKTLYSDEEIAKKQVDRMLYYKTKHNLK